MKYVFRAFILMAMIIVSGALVGCDEENRGSEKENDVSEEKNGSNEEEKDVNEEYTVTFNYENDTGEEITEELSVKYNEVYSELPEPEREDLSFSGWTTEDLEIINEDSTVDIAEDHTLHAHWYTEGLEFTKRHNGYVVVDSHDEFDNNVENDVVIPAIFNDDYVVRIGNYAFRYASSLETITIPSTVTSIGEEAFSRSSLETVNFEEDSQLETIGRYAFSWASSLETITIPSSVTSIGRYAFNSTSSLTNINIPSNVTSIERRTFDTSSLETITFEEDSQLETIGDYAFARTSLTTINIPSNVTSIGEDAFRNITSLETVTFEEDSQLETIRRRAFSNATSLTSINIPSSVTFIGHSAFHRLLSLTSINIPSSVISIGNGAIGGSSSLIIYTEHEEKPGGWQDWNKGDLVVIWGHEQE